MLHFFCFICTFKKRDFLLKYQYKRRRSLSFSHRYFQNKIFFHTQLYNYHVIVLLTKRNQKAPMWWGLCCSWSSRKSFHFVLSSYEAQTRGTALGIFPFQKRRKWTARNNFETTFMWYRIWKEKCRVSEHDQIDQKSMAQILFPKFRLADQHAVWCEETETTNQVNIQELLWDTIKLFDD
jgi:hypothetical protein